MIFFKSKIRFQKIKRWYEQYERFLIPGALLVGVITDVILFQTINITFAFILLGIHFFVSGLTIAFIHIYDAGYMRFRGIRYARLFAPLLLQYTFGALLSGFLIFYWFSSSFAASWPFILIIIALVLSNDLLKRYYLRLPVQIGVYFFIAFSLSVLVLPFITASIGPLIFVTGGVVSLIIITLYLYTLSRLITHIVKSRAFYAKIILVIFLVMNVLYFSNVIPPVPLSVRDAGVFHSIERTNDVYRVVTEEGDLFDTFRLAERIHIRQGERIYFFSAIFAPARLETGIVHHWQRYDTSRGRWESLSRIPFSIVGGRDAGYRGYTFTTQTIPGTYRVRVETARGQVIGQERFRLIVSDERPARIDDIR